MSGVFEKAVNDIKNVGKNTTPPPIPTIQYYVAIDGKQNGPFDIDTLEKMYTDGELSKDSLVWKTGMKNWEEAETRSDLKKIFE